MAVEIEIGNQTELPRASFAIAEDPSVATVVEKKGFLFVTGSKVGKTSVFTWDSNGKIDVVPVKVLSAGSTALKRALSDIKQSISKSNQNKNIKVSYTARGGFGEGISPVPANRYSYEWNVEQLKVDGPSALGKFESYVQFERRDKVSQAVLMYTKLETDRYLAQAGDNWISLTPVLGSVVRYQGFQLSNIDVKGTKFDFFAGSTGMAYWGNDVHRSNSLKTGFVGIRASGRADKNLSFIGSFFTATQFNQPQELSGSSSIRFNLFSLDGIYDYGPFRLESEVAQSYQYRQGISAKLSYTQSPFRYDVKYLSVDSDFKTLSDVYNSAGISGIFQVANYKLTDQVSLFGNADTYSLKTIASGTLYDLAAGGEFRADNYPYVRISANRWDHRNLPGGELNSGFTVFSSYLVKSDNVRFFGQYSPQTFATPSNASAVSGINHRLRAGVETNTRPFVLSDEIGFDSKTLNPIGNYDRSMSNRIKLSLYPVTVSRFENAKIQLSFDIALVRKYFRNTASESSYDGTVKASILNWLGDELYAQINRDGLSSPASTNSVDSFNFEFGINNVFDTGVRLIPNQKQINGVVFDDLNENGLRDAGEPGIPGYSFSSDIQTVQTNEKGEFSISFERDEMIAIDGSKNKSEKVQFQNPFPASLDSNQLYTEIFIPVSYSREYNVVVYLDTNQNGTYDSQTDRLIPNSILKVADGNGTLSFVDEKGEMQFNVNSRKGKFYNVSIDLNSVKNSYLPISASLTRKIVPESDESSTLYFGFKSQ